MGDPPMGYMRAVIFIIIIIIKVPSRVRPLLSGVRKYSILAHTLSFVYDPADSYVAQCSGVVYRCS